MEEFDQVAADLEKAITAEKDGEDLMKSKEAQEILKDPKKIREALAMGVRDLVKAKGAIPTDLSQEEAVKDKNVTDDEDQDDEKPVVSGRGYRDTRPYVGKNANVGKGDDDHDDDDDDDDDKPSFFGKKGKMAKKGKKAHKGDDEADADEVDATEFMDQLGKATDHMVAELHFLRKSLAEQAAEIEELKEGSVIFAQVLADPRRDNLMTTVAKALQRIFTDVGDLRKAIDAKGEETATLLKSIAHLPGVPRAAGLSLMKGDVGGDPAAAPASKVSDTDKRLLMKARVDQKITGDEWKKAMETGDVSILGKLK